MPTLVWDEVGERTYETGVDRGVIYPVDGAAVVWNGLVSINGQVGRKVEPRYYDGIKVRDKVSISDYTGSIRAITYPEIITELEGYTEIYPGFYADEQQPDTFGLSYRTLIGNDVDGNEYGYKIHVVYNATIVPKNTTHQSLKDNVELTTFEWGITATPEEGTGFKPTSHLVIDSRSIEQNLLDDVEDVLYGGIESAYLPDMVDLVSLIRGW